MNDFVVIVVVVYFLLASIFQSFNELSHYIAKERKGRQTDRVIEDR